MALPNFFKDYFYGRSGKRDFTEADLPENRMQLFRDVLSVRRGSMVGVNLLYLLIWLPALFWTFLNLLQLLSPPSDAGEGFLFSLAFSYLTLLFPLIAITGPFNVGISYVLRNWARDEHCFVLSDFSAALKENWRQGLCLGAISGAIPLLTFLCSYIYLQMAQDSIFFALPLAIAFIAAILWNLSAMLLPMMIVTYRQRFSLLVRNALLMTLTQLPKALLIRLATLALPLLLVIIVALNIPIFSIAAALCAIAYLLFMLAFNKLIQVSWANALCEKYLNPQIEGAQSNIGLRSTADTKEKK